MLHLRCEADLVQIVQLSLVLWPESSGFLSYESGPEHNARKLWSKSGQNIMAGYTISLTMNRKRISGNLCPLPLIVGIFSTVSTMPSLFPNR